MHNLSNVVALSERQSASDRCACGRRPLWVERVYVEGEMDGCVGANMRQRELHDAPNTVAVDVVHAEGADVVLTEDELFGAVDVTKADVDELANGEGRGRREPREGEGFGGSIGIIGGGAVRGRAVGGSAIGCIGVDGGGQAGQERNGHAVDVAAE